MASTVFGHDTLGGELEMPFGRGPNALPLDALARTVGIDVRERLGEADRPPALQPAAGVLLEG